VTDVIIWELAVRLLDEGDVVALPTDTVYGLAASLSHPSAVTALFEMKRRPSAVALPVLVDSLDQITRLGVTWPDAASALSRAFWPGPITIVVPVPETLARRVGSASDTVGFRLPDDQLLRGIIARSGPLVVTSANEHGEPPCHSVAEVLNVFGGRGDLAGVVEGGTRAGEVSTVVDVSETPWRLVREGALRHTALAAVLDEL
jgi:L-threonylcarbamoyladenylate synthase